MAAIPDGCEYVCLTAHGGVIFYKKAKNCMMKYRHIDNKWVKSSLYRDISDLYDSYNKVKTIASYLSC